MGIILHWSILLLMMHHLTLVDPIIDESDLLAVSELSEAQKLLEKTDKPILLLSGVYSQDELQSVLALDCHVVVHEKEQINLIARTLCNSS